MSSLPESDDQTGISRMANSGLETYHGIIRPSWKQNEERRTQNTSVCSDDCEEPGDSERLQPGNNSNTNLARLNSRIRPAHERSSHSSRSKLRSVLGETSGNSMRTRFALLQIIHASQPVSRVELARR